MMPVHDKFAGRGLDKGTILNTTYLVKVYLSENATETFEEKVLRLVRNDRSLSMSEERKEHETEEN